MTKNDWHHWLFMKHSILNVISRNSATHKTNVITVNVYIAGGKIVFSMPSGTMHEVMLNVLSSAATLHIYIAFTSKPKSWVRSLKATTSRIILN